MDSRMIRPKAVLLKDYLLDDMSSCSSNGFKSFPRRQCCTTVRFLLDADRKSKKIPKIVKSPPSKSAFTSAFKSVFTAVINEKKKLRNSFLQRSFSKKILKKSGGFWKRSSSSKAKNHKEIQRWKSFDELLKEDSEPLDRDQSKSWLGSDFTVTTKNDVVEEVGVTNGVVLSDSTNSSDGNASINSSTNTKKQWSNEEKEQFSPVSILDCPFDDEDEVSSPFQHRLARMEGTKNKLMKKIQRFECLAQLEPMNLAKRFVPLQDSDNESSGSPLPFSSTSSDEKFISDIEEECEEEVEQKALELLHQIKDTLPPYGLKVKADKLLLDFFREKIVGRNANFEQKWDGCSFYVEILEEAEHWIKGTKPLEFLEWGVQKNREAYVKDMEKGEKWKNLDQKNHEEVALELENEIFDALLNELLLDVVVR